MDYKAAKQNYNIVATRYPNSAKLHVQFIVSYSIAKDVDKNTALANQYKAKLLNKYPQSEEAKFIQKNNQPLPIKKPVDENWLFMLRTNSFDLRLGF